LYLGGSRIDALQPRRQAGDVVPKLSSFTLQREQSSIRRRKLLLQRRDVPGRNI
jgi:hypothetical protein